MRRFKPHVEVAQEGPELRIRFQYDPDLLTAVKSLPVRRWNKANCSWYVPSKFLGEVETVFQNRARLQIVKPKLVKSLAISPNKKLKDYQTKGVELILNGKRVLLSYEMGLGKTATTIEALRQLNLDSPILVVCPAMVRLHWNGEFNLWWPDHPEVGLHTQGDKIPDTPIVVTSYRLAKHLVGRNFGAVVLDESHYVKNARVERSKAVRAICVAPSVRFVIALTATPVTSEPKDVWHQVDCLHPGYLSTWHHFVQRYSIQNPNSFTKWDYRGLKPDKAQELAELLEPITHRVTKKEVAHLLPPFQVQTLRLGEDIERQDIYKQLQRCDNNELTQLLRDATEYKIRDAVELAKDAVECGERAALLCWHKSVAKKVLRRLPPGQTVYVDGDIPTEKRVKALKDAMEWGVKYLVATIASVNVGIDLTYYTAAYCVELYWQTSAMSQLAGRFNRLSGKNAAVFYLLVARGTVDEAISRALMRRFADQNRLWEQGLGEEGISAALDENKSEEDYRAELLKAAMQVEEDAYSF